MLLLGLCVFLFVKNAANSFFYVITIVKSDKNVM